MVLLTKEIDEAGDYDIDFGIKSSLGVYEEAYQLKSAESANSVKNKFDESFIRKINNSTSAKKIYEIEMRDGTFTELEAIQNFWNNLSTVKSEFPNVIFQVKSKTGTKIY